MLLLFIFLPCIYPHLAFYPALLPANHSHQIATAVDARDEGGSVTVALYWRRRDANLTQRLVVVTDANNTKVNLTAAVIDNECGLLTFATPQTPFVYVYWLPHNQSGSGANLHFSWGQAPQGQVRAEPKGDVSRVV